MKKEGPNILQKIVGNRNSSFINRFFLWVLPSRDLSPLTLLKSIPAFHSLLLCSPTNLSEKDFNVQRTARRVNTMDGIYSGKEIKQKQRAPLPLAPNQLKSANLCRHNARPCLNLAKSSSLKNSRNSLTIFAGASGRELRVLLANNELFESLKFLEANA